MLDRSLIAVRMPTDPRRRPWCRRRRRSGADGRVYLTRRGPR
ncbi:hypothetical protein FM125_04265 [Micrococcus lylae]|uniref:Uncharacterized protein n=1 Tax=Micrococcus lylae TaxID=1273 RepID=A0A1R4ISI2_9MICC|nr:hypothetical protein FM125_04265 [Micrococcus lylae]